MKRVAVIVLAWGLIGFLFGYVTMTMIRGV